MRGRESGNEREGGERGIGMRLCECERVKERERGGERGKDDEKRRTQREREGNRIE